MNLYSVTVCICLLYDSTIGLSYFTSHYYLGSKKFETADPERFLYGELSDVNYLTCVPCPVSCPASSFGIQHVIIMTIFQLIVSL